MTQHFSLNLQEWAGQAGFELAPSDPSGAAMFWSAPGGETRFYIRHSDDGWTTLQRSERGGPERFVLATSTRPAMERYLWGLFGVDVRSLRGLPRIETPSEISELAPGYTVSDLELLGVERSPATHSDATHRGFLVPALSSRPDLNLNRP